MLKALSTFLRETNLVERCAFALIGVLIIATTLPVEVFVSVVGVVTALCVILSILLSIL